MAAKKNSLGRGLEALFVDNTETAKGATELEIADISPDRSQPRKAFDPESLAELAASIKEHGVLQPILVRPSGEGYMIVAGERRWRAARLAGLTTVPVLIKELSDTDAMSVAMVENLQREDLNPVEEAEGYKRLSEASGWTQEQIARTVGKSRPTIANSIRLLSLPADVVELLRSGKITAGHAKAILSIADDKTRSEVAKLVAEKGYTVRQAEKLTQKKPSQEVIRLPRESDNTGREVAISLQNALGVQVKVKYNGGKGTLSLDFYSKDQLLDFANRLGAERTEK